MKHIDRVDLIEPAHANSDGSTTIGTLVINGEYYNVCEAPTGEIFMCPADANPGDYWGNV